jgi:hypothetical protein
MNPTPFTTGIAAIFASLALWVMAGWTVNRWRNERDLSALSAYFHLASFISLVAMTVGLAQVLEILLGDVMLDRPELLGGADELRQRLVPRIAVGIVATPIWAFHWTLIQRRARANVEEQRAFIRTLYLYLTLGGAAVASLFLLRSVIAHAALLVAGVPETHSGNFLGAVGLIIPPLAVWWAHWRLATVEPPAAPGAVVPRNFYFYLVAGLALFVAAEGAAGAATASLEALFPSGVLLTGEPLDLLARQQAPALAAMLAGTAFFFWHWGRVRGEPGPRIRLAYLLFVGAAGIAGGLVTGIWIGREGLRYLLGHQAIDQWHFLTVAIPLFVVSGAVFFSHRPALLTAVNAGIDSAFVARRLALYTLNLTGLALGGTAMANLVRILLEFYTTGYKELSRGPDWWSDQTSLFVVMALVGVSLWAVTQRRLQSVVDTGEPEEIRVWPRRLYLYGTLVVVLVIAVINAVGVVRPVIAIALGEPYVPILAAGLYTALANTAIAALIFWYFTRMARADRALTAETTEAEEAVAESKALDPAGEIEAPEPAPGSAAGPRISAIVSRGEIAIIPRIESALGESIHLLGTLDLSVDGGGVELSRQRLAELVADIRSSPGPRVMLIISHHRLDVIPYG